MNISNKKCSLIIVFSEQIGRKNHHNNMNMNI